MWSFNRDPRFRRLLPAGLALTLSVLAIGTGFVNAEEHYKKPPKAILDVLNARGAAQALVSPKGDYIVLVHSIRYPPIAELAQPMYRLAGLRINPLTNGPHLVNYDISVAVLKISGGAERPVQLPPNPKLSAPVWSPDGKYFAFTNASADSVELWIGNPATAEAHKIKGVAINSAFTSPPFGEAFHWMPDGHTLLAQTVPAGRGAAPALPAVPTGPDVDETDGKATGAETFEDLLTTAHDEDLFDYYCTAQLAFVDVASGKVSSVGPKAVFQTMRPSPDGDNILVARVHRPYSYSLTYRSFPKEVEVWDRTGKTIYKLASLSMQDKVPVEGVPTGPRDIQWRPTAPATLSWVEALDGGDTRKKADFRDRVLTMSAPFAGAPTELAKTEQRFSGLSWTEQGGTVLLSDFERRKRTARTFLLDADHPGAEAKLIWNRNVQDRYKDPGTPVQHAMASGQRAIMQQGDVIWLSGQGSSPEGDHPFLDRFSLKTLKAERIFQCDDKSFEQVLSVVPGSPLTFITRRESSSEPPNYYLRTEGAGMQARALTHMPDPTPQLRGITKQLVKYKRADGVELSFRLYLPAGYKQGTRLPTVVWAYPLEYSDANTASQVAGSTNRYTSISGPSELFFLLEGYAVLDDTAMPVVGDPDTVNDTYVEQIVADAKAAIDKAVEMGVTDPERVGVGGHSYGAFMTANLLAHCNLFRAGIARSGAYNRTLTPFGFQNERRTYWQATDLYTKMSPFTYADKIKVPLLMTHGEADNNTGTFPIQSDRLYQAIRGNGGTVRLVRLPHEAHGYSARESTEHVLYEMISWFDKYVKNAPPRSGAQEPANNPANRF